MIFESDYEQSEIRRICYGFQEGEEAVFIPVCEKCGKFVKADADIQVNDNGLKDEPNATCKKCGRTKMLFEGFF